MKTYCLIGLLTIGILQIAAQIAGAETIRMVWFIVPPHVTVADDGVTPQGPTITLFNAIAQKMGYTVKWYGPLPLTRLGLYQKQSESAIDGTILHIKTPAVFPYLYYPHEPYFIGKPSLAVRADDALTFIKTIEDLRGYRIGFVKTFSMSYPPFIKNSRDTVIIDDLTGENWTSRNLGKLLIKLIMIVWSEKRWPAFGRTSDR